MLKQVGILSLIILSACSSNQEILDSDENVSMKETSVKMQHVDLPDATEEEKEGYSTFNLDEETFANFTTDETEGPLEEDL